MPGGSGVLTGACCSEGSCFLATNAAACFEFGGNFHYQCTPAGQVGLGENVTAVGGVLGGDLLSRFSVRFTPGGIRKGAAGYDVCFIHPKGNDDHPIGSEGVLVELVQAPDDVKQAFATIANATA